MAYQIQATDSLITPQECVKYGPVDIHSHAEFRVEFICPKEEKLFNGCFGYDLYLTLLEDKKQYGLTAQTGVTVYTHFRESVNYTVGSYVLYKDELYKVIRATSGVEIPPLRTHFREAEKFNTPIYDLFWKRYLRTILAFCINSESLMFRVVKDTADGLVRKNSEEWKGISTKEAATLKHEYFKMIDDLIANAKTFILKNKDDFSMCTFVSEGECAGTACQKVRHYGFNTRKRQPL